jgi:hypothetical protein
MKKVAVLTGDIIDSTKLPDTERKKLDLLLHKGLEEIAGKNNFEVFRGDSFQVLLTEPGQALKTAVLIRCWLRKHLLSEPETSKKTASGKTKQPALTFSYKKGITDARISIGIGGISYKSKTIRSSDGEAFQLSGRALDNVKNKNNRIVLSTPFPEFNDYMEVTLSLLDILITNWSLQQSEVVYELLNGQTQTAIASKLAINQASVNQRAKTAHWQAVEKTVALFETKIAAI